MLLIALIYFLKKKKAKGEDGEKTETQYSHYQAKKDVSSYNLESCGSSAHKSLFDSRIPIPIPNSVKESAFRRSFMHLDTKVKIAILRVMAAEAKAQD